MNYLSASEYEAYGLEATTLAAWVMAASTIIDGYCRRATLAVAQYQERRRLAPGYTATRLSYLPLAIVSPATSPLVAMRGRYGVPRRGEPGGWSDMASDLAMAFGLPGTWSEIDITNVDFCCETGEVSIAANPLGLGFSEVEVTYMAGMESIPAAVKVACAQIVRNAQATPALNVRASQLDRMRLEYFSESLLDETARTLLAPYVAQKVG